MKYRLDNLKVIELAGVLAGPSAGLFFAELGAKVIKIENPKTKGDVTRSWKLPTESVADDTSAYYWSVNSRKEVVYLDVTHSVYLDVLYTLVKEADVIITNYKLGDDVKLKVDYNTLKQINPQIIYASINGFGTNSPRTAYDLILQAESGFMSMNGTKESGPVKMPVALIDVLAGHQLKEAILLALLKRYETQQGSHISVSLFDTAIASLANQATNWLIAHHLPQLQGSLHPNIAPYGEIFETKDKQFVTFAIGSDKQFGELCRLLNLDQVSQHSLYSTNQLRVINRQTLFDEINRVITTYPFSELYANCIKSDIPIGKLRTLNEVFDLPETKAVLHQFNYNGITKSVVNSVAFKFID